MRALAANESALDTILNARPSLLSKKQIPTTTINPGPTGYSNGLHTVLHSDCSHLVLRLVDPCLAVRDPSNTRTFVASFSFSRSPESMTRSTTSSSQSNGSSTTLLFSKASLRGLTSGELTPTVCCPQLGREYATVSGVIRIHGYTRYSGLRRVVSARFFLHTSFIVDCPWLVIC